MMGKRFQSIVTNFESLQLRKSEVLVGDEEEQERARKGKVHANSSPLRKRKRKLRKTMRGWLAMDLWRIDHNGKKISIQRDHKEAS